MVDPGTLSSSKTIGRRFLAYCAINCSNPANDSEYLPIVVSLTPATALPRYFSTVNGVASSADTYVISHADGQRLAESDADAWKFVPVASDEGFFSIRKGQLYLGVADGDAGRAWGARVSLSPPILVALGMTEISRQQWYFEAIKTIEAAGAGHSYRLINRYSGLALSFPGSALNAVTLENAVTAPIRDWDALDGTGSFKTWKAADQALEFVALRPAAN